MSVKTKRRVTVFVMVAVLVFVLATARDVKNTVSGLIAFECIAGFYLTVFLWWNPRNGGRDD